MVPKSKASVVLTDAYFSAIGTGMNAKGKTEDFQQFAKAWLKDRLGDASRQERLQYAKKLDVTGRYLDMLVSEDRVPGPDLITRLPAVFGVALEEILVRGRQIYRGEEHEEVFPSEFALIPYREAVPGLGGGTELVSKDVKMWLSFRRDWLQRKGRTESMSILQVTGDSMLPTLQDGDIILIDESQTHLQPGKIYFVRVDNAAMAKRLDQEPGHTILISDNRELYPPVRIPKSDESIDFKIIAKVLWFGREIG